MRAMQLAEAASCSPDVLQALNAVCTCSWLRKLELTKQLLVDEKDGALPDDDALAYAFIYLQVTL